MKKTLNTYVVLLQVNTIQRSNVKVIGAKLTNKRAAMKKINRLDTVAYVLILVGGFNWGLVGWLKYNLIDKLFGVDSGASRVIYAAVGVATLYIFYGFYKLKGEKTKQSSNSKH